MVINQNLEGIPKGYTNFFGIPKALKEKNDGIPKGLC